MQYWALILPNGVKIPISRQDVHRYKLECLHIITEEVTNGWDLLLGEDHVIRFIKVGTDLSVAS